MEKWPFSVIQLCLRSYNFQSEQRRLKMKSAITASMRMTVKECNKKSNYVKKTKNRQFSISIPVSMKKKQVNCSNLYALRFSCSAEYEYENIKPDFL